MANYVQVRVENASPAVSYRNFRGRRYLIVPMVMLVEGVHNGSRGPLYYPADELERTPEVWDHKPIVINHPEIDGKPVSACRPDVLERYQVGLVFYSKVENSKLRAEAWLDSVHLEEKSPDVANRLNQRQTIEISTGLFSDMEMGNGVWNGEDYVAVARNYRPDHLAILPDSVGACSVRDGAGLLRNSGPSEVADAIFRTLSEREPTSMVDVYDDHFVYNRASDGASVSRGYSVVDGKVEVDWDSEAVTNVLQKKGDGWHVFSEDGETHLGGPYDTKTKAKERLRQVEAAKATKQTTKNEQNLSEDPNVDKQIIIATLIANTLSPWTEKDREVLEIMTEDRLREFVDHASGMATNETPAPSGNEDPSPHPDEARVENEGSSPRPTLQDFLANAPDEVRPALAGMLRSYEREKTGYVDQLVSMGERCPFSKDQLESKDVEELASLCKLAGGGTRNRDRQPTNFLALADILDPNRAMASNASGEKNEQPLGLPQVTFD